MRQRYTDPFGLSPLNGLFTGTTLWHGILGAVGCIPGPIGAAANFVDCAIYLVEGDYFGAAICFMNGVTMGTTAIVGSLLKAGKLCKVANTALRVAMVSERIAGALTFAQNFYNIGQTGIQMYCKYGIMGESLGLDTVGEVLSIGLSAMGCASGLYNMGHTSKELLALQEKAQAGMLCFVAGTKVKTLDGDKNIEDIEVGDEVWSCDVETGSKRVTRLSVNEARDIAHVTIGGETIDATTTHPFYVEGCGFKPAGQLLAGEKVLLLNGETGEVEAVTVEHLDEPVKVYNFEVEDWHTYYVGELGVLVHNTGCGTSNSYDINKLQKTQSYTYPHVVASIKETIAQDGPNSVPPIAIRVHDGQALVVDGHHRLEAFRQLGYDRVPIKYLHSSQLGKILSGGMYYRSLQELLDARISN